MLQVADVKIIIAVFANIDACAKRHPVPGFVAAMRPVLLQVPGRDSGQSIVRIVELGIEVKRHLSLGRAENPNSAEFALMGIKSLPLSVTAKVQIPPTVELAGHPPRFGNEGRKVCT